MTKEMKNTHKKTKKPSKKKRNKKEKVKEVKEVKEEIESNNFKGYDIIDIELSDTQNKGTLASSNVIDYHYQNLDNIIEYFLLLHKKKKLRSGYSATIRSGSTSGANPIKSNKKMLKNFKDDINFFKPSVDYSLIQVDIPKDTSKPRDKVEGIYTDIGKFKLNFKKFNSKRFTPITINNLLPLSNGQIENHANMLLIDNKSKQIELFEPHGYKPEKSSKKDLNRAYALKIEALKDFFINTELDNSKYKLSTYKFISAADFVQKQGFQGLFDSNSGYCVTWSSLYCHYRILNPDVPVEKIVEYMDQSIVTGTILRYAKHIEDTLKKKT